VWTIEIARRHDAEAAAARALAGAKAWQAKLEDQAGITAAELKAQPAPVPNDAGFTLAGPGGLDQARVAKAAGITEARLRELQLAANLTDEARAAKALAEANRTGDPSDVKGAEYRLGRVRFLGLALANAGTPSDEPDLRRTADGHRTDQADINGVPHVSIGPVLDGLTEPSALSGFTPADALAAIGAGLDAINQLIEAQPAPLTLPGGVPVSGGVAGAIVGAVVGGDDCAGEPVTVADPPLRQPYREGIDAVEASVAAATVALDRQRALDDLVAGRAKPDLSRVDRNDLEFQIREATSAAVAAWQEHDRLMAAADAAIAAKGAKEAKEAKEATTAASGLPDGDNLHPCVN
jgi:hypothetical protein